MKTSPLTITPQPWSLPSAFLFALCLTVLPHIARADDWMQQQQRNAQAAAHQQQQQMNAQQRQQQAQRDIQQMYERSQASGETSEDTKPTRSKNTTSESYASRDAQQPLVIVPQPENSYAVMLLGFIGGAFLTAIALQRKSFAVIAARQLPFGGRYQIKQWFLIAGHYCGTRIRATEIQLKRFFRHSVSAAKNQLLRLIPPRWLVLRVSSLAMGIAIMAASGTAFANWQIEIGFVAMTIGYAIAAATWLVPWFLSRYPTKNSVDTMPTVSQYTEGAHFAPSDSNIYALVNPSDQLLTVVSIVGIASTWHCVFDASPCSYTLPIASTGQLCCKHCKKQFNVRGEGELAIRLVLCPNCGLALRGAADQQLCTFDKELPPILSASCQKCHSLIDIPYLAIGTAISCPRCNAKMLAPDREYGVKHLRRIGHLLHG